MSYITDTSNSQNIDSILEVTVWGPIRQAMNFFEKAEKDAKAGASKAWPPHSFIAGSTVIHLNYDPSHIHISVNEAAELFSLPDLCRALAHYFSQEGSFHNFHAVGQRRHTQADVSLPFNDLQLWYKVCIQQKSYHDTSVICPTFTVNASLPTNGPWKYGCGNATIFVVNEAQHWLVSGLIGAQ